MNNFEERLRQLLNSNSLERYSNTPDFILARYMADCLTNFDRAVNAREKWYGRGTSMNGGNDIRLTPPDDGQDRGILGNLGDPDYGDDI